MAIEIKPAIIPMMVLHLASPRIFFLVGMLANMILSLVLGIIADKPLLTAKRLIIILQMSIMDKPPPALLLNPPKSPTLGAE